MGCSSPLTISNEIFIKIKKIGSKGNICNSFLIKSKRTEDEYVLKTININSNEKESKKVLNDIKILKKINHPNIILLKDSYYSDEDKKLLNIITEYADGGDLQIKLDEQKAKNEYFEEDILLNWFMQICLALKYLHSKKIIHRDIKPSNIFLMKQDSQSFAKLGDFGVAKTLNSTLKYAKTLVTEPQYLSPEIIEKNKYSYEADIWSLGVTFYQLITLNFPFEGDSNEIMQKNILEGKRKGIPPDCKIDSQFLEIINEMLSIRPEERPSAENIVQKGIIKTRMNCYLQQNDFNLKNSIDIINKYEKDDDNEFKKIKKIKVVDYDEKDNKYVYFENFLNENRKKKALYDFNRQMTIMSSIVKRTNSLP